MTLNPSQIKHNRQLWIEALRSGEYKQGQDSLRPTEDTYCCLGVACQLSGLGQWKYIAGWQPTWRFITTEGGQYGTSMPQSIMSLFGLVHDKPDHQRTLAKMNDSGSTFDEIADYIESLDND